MGSGISLYEGACWYGAFLFSTTLHEASHAYVALKLGDDTAYRAGQVSLDPLPHIRREPFGMLVVPILFYVVAGYVIGWASAPYDPEWERRFPRRAALMALAGPLANLLLVIGSALLIHVGLRLHWFALGPDAYGSSIAVAFRGGLPQLGATLLSVMFSLNLLLFVFNLLPLPPLDGSNLPLLFLSPRAAGTYIQYLRHPTFALVGVIVGYRVFPFIFHPVQDFVVSVAFP